MNEPYWNPPTSGHVFGAELWTKLLNEDGVESLLYRERYKVQKDFVSQEKCLVSRPQKLLKKVENKRISKDIMIGGEAKFWLCPFIEQTEEGHRLLSNKAADLDLGRNFSKNQEADNEVDGKGGEVE